MKYLISILLTFFNFCLSAQVVNQKCEELYKNAYELSRNGKNYSLAIRKISAYKLCATSGNHQKADALLIKIYETVNKQKEDAIKAKNEAELQAKIAFSHYLASEAKSAADRDPTRSLRLLEAAYKIHSDPNFERTLIKLYRESSFYKTLCIKKTSINSVVFAPDKKSFLVLSNDSILQLLNIKGRVIKEYRGHKSAITVAAFSSTGDSIITASNDSTICLWKTSGVFLKKINGHNSEVTAIAFSPNGQNILTGSNDGIARLRDLNGIILKVFKGHQKKIISVSFSSSNYILTRSWDNTTRLWAWSNDNQKLITNAITLPSNAFFLPNGKAVMYFSKHTATLCDLNGLTIKEFIDSTRYISKIAISPNEKHMLFWSNNSAVLRDFNGKIVEKLLDVPGYIQSLEFSPDSKTILASFQQNVLLLNLKGRKIQEFVSPDFLQFSYAGFTQEEDKIITISGQNTLRSWIIKEQVKEFESPALSSVAFSPNGKYILVGAWDGKVRIFDPQGNLIKQFNCHTKGITSVAISSTGDRFLTGSNDSVARLWDDKGQLLKELKGHSGKVLAVAFSPDGKNILTSSTDQTARLWDLGGQFSEFKCKAFVTDVAFSPDNKWIVMACGNGVSYLYNIKNKTTRNFKIHSQYITSIEFSPDSKTVLTGSLDFTACLWNLAGKTLRVFKRADLSNNAVTSASFSRDGKFVLTCMGSMALIWDLKGNILQEFKSLSGPIISGTLSPDGKSLITGSTIDNAVRLWKIPLRLKDFLKDNNIEQLTNDQKKEYNLKI